MPHDTNSSPKKRYSRAFLEVRAAINKLDPMGLVETGCPEDEYDAEVAEILSQLQGCADEEEIRRVCADTFTKWFERAHKPSQFETISAALLEIRNNTLQSSDDSPAP